MSHKNDPDYHDWRAKILLEAANHLKQYTKENFGLDPKTDGLNEAVAELRRLASNARRAHKKVQDKRRQESRHPDMKSGVFRF